MAALGRCRSTPEIEESYPEIIVVQLPEALSYWELLTEQEQTACLELGKKGREVLFNSEPTADKTMIRGLDLVRRAWELSPDTGCDSYGGCLQEYYESYACDPTCAEYRKELRKWFLHWNEVYKKQAHHGNLLNKMRYYFWPANGMEEQERKVYFEKLRALYTERTGKEAPDADCRC